MNKFNRVSKSSFIASTNIDYNISFVDIHWKTQLSTETSVLFVRYNENAKKYLSEAKYGIIVFDKQPDTNYDNSIIVKDGCFEEFQKEVCDLVYPLPEKSYIGVTGTNGKTSVVSFIKQAAIQSSRNIISIGTLGVFFNDELIFDYQMTTPPFIDLRKILYEHSNTIDIVAMELSSHGFDQKRFIGLKFDMIFWTNISRDHLDYHKTFENYFNAKKECFKYLKPEGSVFIPKDQELLSELENVIEVPLIDSENDLLNLGFNKINFSLAHKAFEVLGFGKIDTMKMELAPGRFNIFEINNNKVIIDFAHTPDALSNLILQAKEMFPNKRIVTVFGCGGDRDKGKRAQMGKIASTESDLVYITNDNPRYESPVEIAQEVEKGVQGNDYVIEIDRKKAIEMAIKKSVDSIILIAGKGSEPYMEIEGKKTPFSDFEIIKNI